MTQLSLYAHWHHATREPDVRKQVEQAYVDRLVELCEGVENAHRLKENWHRQGEPAFHAWRNYQDIAFTEAVGWMPPSEIRGIRMTLEFKK